MNFQMSVRKNPKRHNGLHGYECLAERRDFIVQIKQSFNICTSNSGNVHEKNICTHTHICLIS